MAVLYSIPDGARPFLGDTYRRPRDSGQSGEAVRQRAISELASALARPSRLMRQILALVLISGGLSLLATLVPAGQGPGAGSSDVPSLLTPGSIPPVSAVLGGTLTLAAGVLLAIGPVREGGAVTRALQGWLAEGVDPAGAVLGNGTPSLRRLLSGAGVFRIVGSALLLLSSGVALGRALGGDGTPVVPAALTLAVMLGTAGLVAVGTARLVRGRRGHAPRRVGGTTAEGTTAFAPQLGAPTSAWGVGAPVAAAPPVGGVPGGVPAPVAPSAAGPPPVTQVPRPAPLVPGVAHALPVNTTEPGPISLTAAAAAAAAAWQQGQAAAADAEDLDATRGPGRPLPVEEDLDATRGPGRPVPPTEDLDATRGPGRTPAVGSGGRAAPLESTVLRGDLDLDLAVLRRLVVVLEEPGAAPRELGVGRWLLGRAPAASDGEDGLLPLVVGDPAVSKTHLLLEVAESVVTVTDRASSNGTGVLWAGGRRRLQAWESTTVAAGETVVVGALRIRVGHAAPASG